VALRRAATAPCAPVPAGDRCPRCDGAFACGIDSGMCWCAAVTLTPERRQHLAGGYEGCLCPACLRELAAPA
jgi:hypothetical protein